MDLEDFKHNHMIFFFPCHVSFHSLILCIFHFQMCMEEERCKILQIDSKLEEILDTTSYFLDTSQEILEILTGRIVWIETNEEPSAELPVKDWHSLKQDYDLLSLQSILQKNSRKM